MSTSLSPELKQEDGKGPSEPLLFPCSSSQERCWFIDALSPGTSALNVALRWEIKGRFSRDTVEQAFQKVIDRHEILRTRFLVKDGALFQEVAPHYQFKLTVIDLTIHPEEKRLDEALALGAREAHLPFDVANLPLIRASLLMLSPTHAIILVAMHQIVFDGSSIRILANDFATFAEAIDAHKTPDLPELPLQYGDFSLWQKEYFSSEGFETEAAFWKKQLAGMRYFEIPSDYKRPPLPTTNCEILASVLPGDLGSKIEETARNYNVTLFSLGCAIIGATLHRYTGQNEVIFATQIANRDEPELENMIGIFINNIVMRLNTSGDPTFREFVGNVNKVVQNSLIHRRMPFNKLVELLNPPRDPSRLPLISVSFTVLFDVMESKRYGNFELIGQPSLSAGTVYDFNFFLVHWPSGWRMAVEYNKDLFDRATAQGLLDFLVKTFELIIQRPQDHLSVLQPPLRETAKILQAADERFTDLNEALLRHSDVGDVVVVPHASASGNPRAYVYVVPSMGSPTPLETLPKKLLDYVARTLPGIEQPEGISILLTLPRLADGSVNFAALPQPSPASASVEPVSHAAEYDGAQGLIEAKLASIWEDVLKVKNVRPDSNFFELGGHSLLAVRMMVQVEQTFGTKLDILTLFQSPTIRQFAKHLSLPEKPDDHWTIVSIQPEGDKIPIIIINNTMRYYNLARMIGSDRPMIGIQLEDMTGSRPVSGRSLSDIASDYIAPIRAARPHGPYILGGLCVSGSIAYEVAHQLRQAGESVPLVIMVDNWVTPHLKFLPRFLYGLEFKINYMLEDWGRLRRGEENISQILVRYQKLRKSGLLHLAAALRLIPKLPPRPDDETAKRLEQNYLSFYPHLMTARAYYTPPRTNDHVVVLESDETAAYFSDPLLGWDTVAKGKLDVWRIPGLHEEILYDEGARLIADHLRPVLADVDSKYPRR
ncbi:condensation domain-containing protein [Beijerinckia indica]|uniref:Condensation domain protein n=1 Tax=Beijerinckia indica subsp. indica (strain ATCC 9039 / DSM 1715 / NCIMB 8712) TaxID=395963 RepID=B2IHH6_BEII9|nr:condensation domain-containing protein [Beijerinckia indica]ACB94497.1 condensation domain protein [Beijerinckia indica subsp. indica ATCC 9039]